MIQIKKVLHPTDFSDNSREALEYALAFSKWQSAEIVLLHVCEEVEYAPPEYYMDKDESVRQLKERSGAALAALDKVAATHEDSGVQISTTIASGKPFDEIIKTAQDIGADLIVLGTHGRTGLAHILIGSTAEKVVRKASCPVLTVRSSSHKFSRP